MVSRQRQKLWQLLAPAADMGAHYRAGSPATRARLGAVSGAFLRGVRHVLVSESRPAGSPNTPAANAALAAMAGEGDGLDSELLPFVLEGIGAGALMCDHLERTSARRQRASIRTAAPGHLDRVLTGAEPAVAALCAIGAGWALARLGQPRAPQSPPESTRDKDRGADIARAMDDGYGFHEGTAHGYRFASPRRFPGATAAFDRGLGRGLWFVRGGEAAPIARAIAGFASDRQPALWIGVGVAAAFTGGVEPVALRELGELASDHRGALSEGVCLARQLRSELGGVMPHHTEMAAATLGEPGFCHRSEI